MNGSSGCVQGEIRPLWRMVVQRAALRKPPEPVGGRLLNQGDFELALGYF